MADMAAETPMITPATGSSSTPEESEMKKGKLGYIRNKITEKSALHSAEKKFGMTWDGLHAYKELMTMPALPPNMPRELIPQDISFCDQIFRGIDRCIEQGIRTERVNYPYERMQICKPFWIKFDRCIKRRDEKILNSIYKWETRHMEKMASESRIEYLEDLGRRRKYQEYAYRNTQEPTQKIFHAREGIHLEKRAANLGAEKETRPPLPS